MEHYLPTQQASGSSLNLAINQNSMTMTTPLEHNSELVVDRQQSMLNLATQHTSRYMNQRDKILMYQLNQYYIAKATQRSKNIAKTIQEVVKIVHDVLRELEIQEPRFISTFTEVNGHYEGNLFDYIGHIFSKKN